MIKNLTRYKRESKKKNNFLQKNTIEQTNSQKQTKNKTNLINRMNLVIKDSTKKTFVINSHSEDDVTSLIFLIYLRSSMILNINFSFMVFLYIKFISNVMLAFLEKNIIN